MRNYNKSSNDLKKFRANKHLYNIKDNIDHVVKAALDSKVVKSESHLGCNIETKANLTKHLYTLHQEL